MFLIIKKKVIGGRREE